MIIEDPLKFFHIPEQVVVVNIYDIVNRFANLIEEYLPEIEAAVVTNNGEKVILFKSDKITDAKGEVVKFEHFFKFNGDYFVNDEIKTFNSAESRRLYKWRSKLNITTNILLAFIKEDISRRSNWETATPLEDQIKDYIDPKFDVSEVCCYITERIDPLIITIGEYYYNRDWNIFDVCFDGYRLTIKRYGDWRAYKWNKEQYDALQLANQREE